MDAEQFREFGKAAVDYIADYYQNIRDRQVLPSVKPGYLQDLIPNEAPQNGEPWQDLLKDIERVIMPGTTHWLSPNFHAYYPSGNSFPAIIGELISFGMGVVGVSWQASPASTELEAAMMDWLGKMFNLPEEFLNCSKGPGGGVIQGTASEAALVCLLAAKEKTVREIRAKNPNLSEADIKGKLVAYSSDQSNSSVEKAGIMGSVPMRLLPTDKDGKLCASTLEEAMKKDKENGFIPCYYVANWGTTGTCAFDNLEELGPVCEKENVWIHIDAAYAGAAFVCPEYRYLMKGIKYAESYVFNAHKWMLVNMDCSCMWVKNAQYLTEALDVQRIYLKHQHDGKTPEYRNWQIPLGRRNRAIKMWFTLRSYGIEGIRKHIRTQVALAKYFEKIVEEDNRFEVCTSSMGLVCFRLKGPNELTQKLLKKLTDRKKIYCIPCTFSGKFVIRFVVTSRVTEIKDIDLSFKEISEQAADIVGAPITDLNNNILKLENIILKDKECSIKIAPKELPNLEKLK